MTARIQLDPGEQRSLVLAASGTAAFLALAFLVTNGASHSFDDAVLATLRLYGPGSGYGWLTELALDVTALGGVAVLVIVTTLVAAFLWVRRSYGAMTLVASAVAGGGLLDALLKHSFLRERPDLEAHLDVVASASFPSGHAMLSAVVYLTLGSLLAEFADTRRLRLFFLGAAGGLAALVGASRLLLAVHYPTDVLAGWSVGVAWASLCWYVARRLQARRVVEPHPMD